jgi:hypothetical protein
LFTAGGAVNYHDSLDGLDGRITDAMNEALVRPFIAEEVRTALFQMAPLKAPGPDGFNAGFFQKHWDIVEPEVCKAVLYSLNNATLDSVLNSTFIALIPKMSSPTSVTEFRPISLCNALYKIISKIPTGKIIPTRGIRQGDPISPYLFLICAEVLSSSLIKADREGVLEGVPSSKRGPRLNYLFFADDSLLFC